MISGIKLKFGRGVGGPAAEIRVTPITVFVGPNNSGKSKVLSEVLQFCLDGSPNSNAAILDGVFFEAMSAEEVEAAIASIQMIPSRTEVVTTGNIIVGKVGIRQHLPRTSLEAALKNPAANTNWFCNWYMRHRTLMLGGAGRIDLVGPTAAGDLQEQPQSSLQRLFRDDERRAEVRRIIEEAFGTYFVIDPTHLGQLRIRLSNRAPHFPSEERGIDKIAVDFHAAALPIEVASDGVKAFTGIITQVIAGDPQVLLIDEPEAFLHPSLAFKMGTELASAALLSDKNIFVSTHSAQFVQGCIQSGAEVTIVRLTYRGGVATGRVLPSAKLLTLMRNPLLRSTGVLSGLFYEFIIVTESDSDRAFYQEINERLLRSKREWGIPNCLFINAQNKQTVHTILRPLRELGIPAVGIVDIDALKDGGTVWINLLSGASMPSLSQGPLGQIRAALKQVMDNSGKDMKRDGGTAILQGSDREAAENLLAQMADYGIFVVPGGELESWLKKLGATGHGPAWLIDIFEKMGENPDAVGYVRPEANDVWQFISSIRSWLFNPARKGIPS